MNINRPDLLDIDRAQSDRKRKRRDRDNQALALLLTVVIVGMICLFAFIHIDNRCSGQLPQTKIAAQSSIHVKGGIVE